MVELLAQLRLDQRALLLDDHDRLQPFGEGAHALRLERPGAGELEEADTESVGLDFIDAERFERLAHVGIGLAGSDNAEPRPRPAGQDHPVEPVGTQEPVCRRQLVAGEPHVLIED